jgi:hypothetical protein
MCFNQLGFQLAMGPNVKLCQNLSILGADKFLTTYSAENKMPNPGRMISVLGDWLEEFEKIRKRDLKMIESFNSIAVPDHEVHEIIGELTAKRIRRESNRFPKEPLPPLNQSQIGQFATKYLISRADATAAHSFNLWDIYNMATELYKPDKTDMPILLSSNYAMAQYLSNRYNLN